MNDEKLVLLDYGAAAGKLHLPSGHYRLGRAGVPRELTRCGLLFDVEPRIRFEDEAAREDICRRCLPRDGEG